MESIDSWKNIQLKQYLCDTSTLGIKDPLSVSSIFSIPCSCGKICIGTTHYKDNNLREIETVKLGTRIHSEISSSRTRTRQCTSQNFVRGYNFDLEFEYGFSGVVATHLIGIQKVPGSISA